MSRMLYVLPQWDWAGGAAELQRMSEKAYPLETRYLPDGRMTAGHMSAAEVIFGAPDPVMLAQAPQLQWLHLPCAGADRYADLRLYANSRVTLTTSAGVYGVPMAEHALMLFLALARMLREQDAEWGAPRELYKATVVILGLGDVGRTLAVRLSSFETRTLGVRRNLLEKPPHVHELFDMRGLHMALAQADFIAGCLPLTRETAGLLDAAAFAAMKPGAVFVNVGRGPVVDTAALCDALTGGHLWGAGLDVTDPEPLPPEHPLRSLPNVILTPHAAGLSVRSVSRRLALFERQLTRYLAGRSLYNVVDFFRGY